jgi:hypothetical protein
MASQLNFPETFVLRGDALQRLRQLLTLARAEAQAAQAWVEPRLEDALVELTDTLSDDLAKLHKAEQDDISDAEYSGAADWERQSWNPLRAA